MSVSIPFRENNSGDENDGQVYNKLDQIGSSMPGKRMNFITTYWSEQFCTNLLPCFWTVDFGPMRQKVSFLNFMAHWHIQNRKHELCLSTVSMTLFWTGILQLNNNCTITSNKSQIQHYSFICSTAISI